MDDDGTKDVAARVAHLRRQILHHDHRYHVLDAPEIADDAYDALLGELRELEAEHPALVTPDSPTQRVGGAPLATLATATHVAPMLSLDSSASEAGFRQFDARVRKQLGDAAVRYSLEPKLDGLSIELVFEHGWLQRAVTRGDGSRGELVTANVRTIRTLPERLRDAESPLPQRLAVRGEVFLALDAFDDLNEALLAAGKTPFANPRNAAAGTIRQLDPELAAARPLSLCTYDLLGDEVTIFATHGEVLEALRAWGLPVNADHAWAADADEALAHFDRLARRRDALPYEIDGLVVKLDDLAARRALGATAHHPRWAYAIKFPPRKEVSQVLRIAVSVGRTGAVTPVALLRPVSIGGVTVSRANLHNREDIERKDIREGDTVRVERAGDVIPQVVERVDDGGPRGEPFRMPERCPSCHAPLEPRGPYTVCPNAFECPAQLTGRIVHFASRRGLDIDGLGERTARQLVDRGLVRHLPDLFDLDQATLASLEGFAEVSARNVQQAIERARRTELPRLLYGLGIPEVGVAVAQTLALRFGTFEALRAADVATLEAVDGIGPVMAEAIHGFLHEPRNAAVLDALMARIETEPIEVTEDRPQPLRGATVVFTGAMERFTREQAQRVVQRLGGKAAGSVSKRTTLLVAGRDAGSKLDKARELGLEVLDEEAFVGYLEGLGVDARELGGDGS
jgi:DNA ligase (NAD+)